jgi:hypothetical protein
MLRFMAAAPAKPAVSLEHRTKRRVGNRSPALADGAREQRQRRLEAGRESGAAGSPEEVVRPRNSQLVEGAKGVGDLRLQLVRRPNVGQGSPAFRSRSLLAGLLPDSNSLSTLDSPVDSS